MTRVLYKYINIAVPNASNVNISHTKSGCRISLTKAATSIFLNYARPSTDLFHFLANWKTNVLPILMNNSNTQVLKIPMIGIRMRVTIIPAAQAPIRSTA